MADKIDIDVLKILQKSRTNATENRQPVLIQDLLFLKKKSVLRLVYF